MSGQWINCSGSGIAPAEHAVPEWAIRSGMNDERRREIRNTHGRCAICGKVVALKKDGTCRVHVNSPEAKRIREQARDEAHERSITDLLKLRRELGAR